MSNFGRTAYQLTYQISPIMLVNGIATFMPGGMLPIISLTESVNFVSGVLSGGGPEDLDSYFAHFQPMSGGKLISQDIATYPLANQAVAANAAITKPLPISLMMVCPAKGDSGMLVKIATMQMLKATLENHNSQGGTFIVATPAFFYANCVLLDMTDVSAYGETKQPQVRWQLDFTQPLITLQQAQQAQSAAMSKITAGLPTSGALTGLDPTVNVPPSLATLSVVPAASGPGAAAVAPLAPVTSSPLPPLSPGPS